MKHVRNFENFRKMKNAPKPAILESYYKKGKACRKSIFEMELLKEGYSPELISEMDREYSMIKLDSRIIDCVYEYLNTGSESGIDLLTEELTVRGFKLPGLGDMYKGVAGVVDKGIQIGKSVITSFKDFIKNIGNVVKNLFAKIKEFFSKIWAAFKPNVIKAMGVVKKAIGGAPTEKLTSAIETMSGEAGQKEIDTLSADLAVACGKLSSGGVVNTSDAAAASIEAEASEYDGIEGDADIEKLMGESVESLKRKGSVGKLYYSIKGYLSEGGTMQEISDAIFEAEEAKAEFKEGDEVTYTNKEGKKVTKKIVRIEGDNAVFKMKDSEEEFTKPVSDLKKAEGIGSKITQGFIGEEPEKKGVFGWLVEAVGLVFNPLAKLKETMIKGGTNGICTLISAMARGLKNAVKFVVVGVIAGLVYHIVHGIMELTGGGHGEGQGHEGEEAAENLKDAKEAPKAAPAAAPAAAKGPSIKKESYEHIFESENVDMNKHSKYTDIWDTVKSAAIPTVGSLLIAVLSKFFPIIHTILEGVLVSIGIFELVGAVCQIESVKSKKLKVCTIQHNIHHFLEAKAGGAAAH
jgi:hypothetical protein